MTTNTEVREPMTESSGTPKSYYVSVDKDGEFDFPIADGVGFIETDHGAWMRSHDVERALSLAQLQLEACQAENKRLKLTIKDMKDGERAAVVEAMWRERQGDDYGTY